MLLASPGVLYLLEGTDSVLIFVCLESSKWLSPLWASVCSSGKHQDEKHQDENTMHTSTIRIFSPFQKYKLIYTVALKSVKHTELSSVRTQGHITWKNFSILPNKILGKEEIETYMPILQNWGR